MLIAKNSQELNLLPQMSNRHGLIAGATGTGKTVTLQSIAEQFSLIGVPDPIAGHPGPYVRSLPCCVVGCVR